MNRGVSSLAFYGTRWLMTVFSGAPNAVIIIVRIIIRHYLVIITIIIIVIIISIKDKLSPCLIRQQDMKSYRELAV
jgi:hypothetical protein